MSSEAELVQWLKQFKNRQDLVNEHGRVYVGLRINYPNILDIAFPDTVSAKKEQILQMAINGEDKPIKHKSKLGQALITYITPRRNYDEEFTNKLKEIRPDWFENRQEKQKRLSFERMLRIMPSYVKFKEGQKWEGVMKKYIFICKKYGEFESNFDRISRSWKKGLSGHPQIGRDSTAKSTGLRNKQLKRDDKGRILSKTTKQ